MLTVIHFPLKQETTEQIQHLVTETVLLSEINISQDKVIEHTTAVSFLLMHKQGFTHPLFEADR